MEIGIGIPNTVLDVPGATFTEWASRAEGRGFSSLATIGRVAYPGYDELVALTAAAAVTGRIALFTNILLAPAFNTAQLAKTTASVDSVSGGRLRLGLAVGARPDDFGLTGQDFRARGKRFDAQLEALHDAWVGKPIEGADQPVAPTAVNGRIPILFGGSPGVAAPRAVKWGGGYTIGGAPPERASSMAEEFRALYAEHGGEGKPRIVALNYFSLGEEHTEESLHNLRSYYAWLADWAEGIAQGAARSGGDIRDQLKAFEEAGIDELVWDPSVANVDQVDRLADIVFG